MRRLTIVYTLTVVAFLMANPALAEVRLALIIANQAYTPQVGALVNPHKDAQIIQQALERQGFEVTVVKDATRGQILAAVDTLADNLRAHEPKAATGFLYYAGHGLAEPQRAQNYIIPVNVVDASSRAIWYDSVKLDDVRHRLLEGAPNAAHLVVFDACRNELAIPTRGSGNGFAAVAQLGGMLTAFSASPGQLASDGDANDEGGPYAKALAAQLNATFDNASPVSASRIFGEVRRLLVNSETPQEPIYSDGLNSVVTFGGGAKEPEPEPQLTVQQTAPNQLGTVTRQAPSQLSREEAAWHAYALAQEINTVAALRDVQELYSDTLGGRQAGRKADAMEEEAAQLALLDQQQQAAEDEQRGLIRQQDDAEHLEQERQKAEAERQEKERQQAEAERLERERQQAEEERLERERQQAEAERLERERRLAEAERLEKERQQAEAERLERERRQAQAAREERERQQEAAWRPSRAEALDAQRELRRLGLYQLAIDGDWGGGSRRALASFQRQNNLSPADGALTPELLAKLRQTPTPARAQPQPAPKPEKQQECFSFEGSVWCAGE